MLQKKQKQKKCNPSLNILSPWDLSRAHTSPLDEPNADE